MCTYVHNEDENVDNKSFLRISENFKKMCQKLGKHLQNDNRNECFFSIN